MSAGFFDLFSVIPVIVSAGFLVVLGFIIALAARFIGQWSKNNASPVLTVEARVVAKRLSVSHGTHHHGTDTSMHHTTGSTACYVTFEVQSGDRMELRVPGGEYGMLIEGDRGSLTFQGTRYKGFERTRL